MNNGENSNLIEISKAIDLFVDGKKVKVHLKTKDSLEKIVILDDIDFRGIHFSENQYVSFANIKNIKILNTISGGLSCQN